jgi:capsular exopolysaccharide synthesis family protein
VSPTKGEGTSTVLTNFAITLATGGDTVLVVDANHRNPSLHNTLNVEKKGGLTELLHDKYHMRAVIKKTQIKNLSVITSGIPLSNPFSIFDSIALDNLITQMKLQADWVLFDSPPINVYNDASALAAKMDGVVMVVQAENTRWEVAQSANKKIKNAKVNLLGVILNRRKMHIPDWAYKML